MAPLQGYIAAYKWGRGKIYIYKAKPLTAADDHGPTTGIYSCGQTFQGVVGCKGINGVGVKFTFIKLSLSPRQMTMAPLQGYIAVVRLLRVWWAVK